MDPTSLLQTDDDGWSPLHYARCTTVIILSRKVFVFYSEKIMLVTPHSKQPVKSMEGM